MDINHKLVGTLLTFAPTNDRGAAWMRAHYFAHFDNGVVRFALNIDGERAEANRFISHALNDGQDLGGLTGV